MLFYTLTNEVIYKNKVPGKVMICKAFSFNPANFFFFRQKTKIQCNFLELENSKVTYYWSLLNILNSSDLKRCLILLKVQYESNLKLVLSITLALLFSEFLEYMHSFRIYNSLIFKGLGISN